MARCVALAALALAACGGNQTRPDLARLYRVGTQFAHDPGHRHSRVFGSKLRDPPPRLAWPGTCGDPVRRLRHLALDVDLFRWRYGTIRTRSTSPLPRWDKICYGDHQTLRDFGGYVADRLLSASPGSGVLHIPTTGADHVTRRRSRPSIKRSATTTAICLARRHRRSHMGVLSRATPRYGPRTCRRTRVADPLYGRHECAAILLGTPNMGSVRLARLSRREAVGSGA